jgi:cell wall assembly regulator SMI1
MIYATALAEAFGTLLAALESALPGCSSELRPATPLPKGLRERPGTEQLCALWDLTGGQTLDGLGIFGGLTLLGHEESEHERNQWLEMGASEKWIKGEGANEVVDPAWDTSSAREPEAVRSVYFASGWLPILKEPMEGNYLAVDTVPLHAGKHGQIILCGRDEEEKCVVAEDLVSLLQMLTRDARVPGNWRLAEGYVAHAQGRLLNALRDGLAAPTKP